MDKNKYGHDILVRKRELKNLEFYIVTMLNGSLWVLL